MDSDRIKLLVMYYIGYSIKTLKIKKHIDTNREYNFYHPNMYRRIVIVVITESNVY